MIIEATRISSGQRDIENLLNHVFKAENDEINVFDYKNRSLSSNHAKSYVSQFLETALEIANGHKDPYCIRHVVINSHKPISEVQRLDAQAAFEEEFDIDLSDRPKVVIQHKKTKLSLSGEPLHEYHDHVFYLERSLSGKILSNEFNYLRHERVSRGLEVRFGHEITHGMFDEPVLKHISKEIDKLALKMEDAIDANKSELSHLKRTLETEHALLKDALSKKKQTTAIVSKRYSKAVLKQHTARKFQVIQDRFIEKKEGRLPSESAKTQIYKKAGELAKKELVQLSNELRERWSKFEDKGQFETFVYDKGFQIIPGDKASFLLIKPQKVGEPLVYGSLAKILGEKNATLMQHIDFSPLPELDDTFDNEAFTLEDMPTNVVRKAVNSTAKRVLHSGKGKMPEV
ncbi:hypothetical protein [Terasakiella pusilla]|uniref:hypothetical protein n=1 Tax=Terasakiella pusilla TaxID=64973 RepID=UPI00048FD8AF|nr:hypothetical protein [Terasakiella pusilla]